MKSAYDDYVSTLPAQGYDSAGTLLWQPNWSDATSLRIHFYGSVTGSNFMDFTSETSYTLSDFARCRKSGRCIDFSFSYQSLRYYRCDVMSAVFPVPISGYYRQLNSTHWSCAVKQNPASGQTEDSFYTTQENWLRTDQNDVGSQTFGSSVSVRCSASYGHGVSLKGGNATAYTPVYSIIPASEPVITNNYYISTRVNNFNGDYYDSVTNNYYNNTTIVNETTNNYYDMTTNNTYTMSNWSYDYASRTYFITLEDGTTVTVQFGDDCMTITKNDVTNSYKYVIKNNSTPDTPTGCKHDWQETIDTAPTCLEGGHASYTCSLCGETYEQNLAAKGHNWKVKEHVNTVYNADGTVETQGHTLYECSVCGEQWYTDTGAPPPDVSGSNTIIAWLTNFQTWLDGKFELFVDKLQIVVDNSETNIENVTNVVIEETNNAYNVFYVTTEDGDKKPVGEVAGDTLSASGKLLNFLYKLCFEGALSKVDDSISDMDGFYFDSGAGMEGNIWD